MGAWVLAAALLAAPESAAAYDNEVSLELGWSAGGSNAQLGLLTPRAALALSPTWQLSVAWPLAMLGIDGGDITNVSGEVSADIVPRTGNPNVELRFGGLPVAGRRLELGFGLSLPMASIATPTPATGVPFERAPHSEAVYRWALGARGFVAPWDFLWNTATTRLFARHERELVGLIWEARADLGLLIPAGPLRAHVGLVAAAGLSARYELGDLDVGLGVDLGGVTAQRAEFQRRLQLEGVQLALSPELGYALGPLRLALRVVLTPGLDIDPAPPTAWGASLGLSAQL